MKVQKYSYLLILLVITTFCNAQNSLMYNLSVGDSFTVTQSTTQDIVQDMNGAKHEMKNVMNADFSFIVEKVTDSLYDIKFRFNNFKMASSSNLYGEIMTIDTTIDAPEEDIQAQIFSQLVYTELNMKMYKNGKIKVIEGADQLIEKMISVLKDVDAFTKEMIKESMKGEFSGESLTESFEQMTYFYPSKKVSVGDSWTNQFTGEMVSNNTWTLKAIQDDTATINGESDIKLSSDDNEILMELSGTMTTNIEASLKTGFLNIMKSTSDASGDSTMKTMNNIKVPTSIITNTTYKIERNVQ